MEFDYNTPTTRHASGALEINLQSRRRARQLAKSVAGLHGKSESRGKTANNHSKGLLAQLLAGVRIFFI
jgi:hypothetical protein